MKAIRRFIQEYLKWLSLPDITVIDILEIAIIAFTIYHIIIWVKKTRAYTLLKGILVLFVFYLFAFFFDMSVILWIFEKSIAIGVTAIIIIFQPELRNALEQLGNRNILNSIRSFDEQDKNIRFSDRTVSEIIRATFELAKTKTGALMIIEKDISLVEFERTGIMLDSVISSQLLINIFEHNTPLHDGAVIIRGNRIIAATCYLPLSDNMSLSKELGTRHRAAVGLSEVSDSLTIIVSEETGKVSVASEGRIRRNIDGEVLGELLRQLQGKSTDSRKRKLWKGRRKT